MEEAHRIQFTSQACKTTVELFQMENCRTEDELAEETKERAICNWPLICKTSQGHSSAKTILFDLHCYVVVTSLSHCLPSKKQVYCLGSISE